MRVDGPSVAQPKFLDPREKLRLYRSAFRRRWFLVAVPTLLGAALAFLTASGAAVAVNKVGVPVNATTYYKAAHVLTVDRSAVGANGTVLEPDLAQTAYLAGTGVVPKQVAQQLDMKERDVQESVIGFPRTGVGSVEVVAISTDAEKAVKLADTTAMTLIMEVGRQNQSNTTTQRDEIVSKLDELDQQIADLNTRIAANPPDRPQLEAQQRSLTNAYSSVYEQFTQLSQNPVTTVGLVTLEAARSAQISKYDYDEIRRQIRDGADYVTGKQTTTPADADRSVGGGPSAGMSRTTRGAMGAVVGFGLGVGLVLVLERFDGRLRRREVVEEETGLPVVAEIPELTRKEQHGAEVVVATRPRSHVAEAYRVVRSAVLFALSQKARSDDSAIVLLVTSPNPGEGKTTTVANLAAVLAEGGLKVLVINCDFRRPRVHAYLLGDGKAPADAGVAIDTGSAGVVHLTQTSLPGVRLVTGLGEGDPNVHPLEVIALQRKVVDLAKPLVDVILLDTAPFLATNDAGGLLDLADQVLLVLRSGKTTVEAARRSAEVLQRFDAPVLGVVFNASSETPDAQYYYGYASRDAGRQTGPVGGVTVAAD